MNWDKDDDKDQTDKDKDYVSKDNSYEIPDMVDKYKEDYPTLTEAEIEKVINDCRDKVGAPFPRESVEKCVEKNLETKKAIRDIAKRI